MIPMSSGLRDTLLRCLVLIIAGAAPLSGAGAAVVISTDVTKNMTCSGGVCTPTGPTAVLNVTQLTNMLARQSVTVGTSAQASDIVVNAPFSWVSGNGLTLQAIGNLTFDKHVSDCGPGPVWLTYDATGAGGNLSFGKRGSLSFCSTANPLTINGQSYTLVNTVESLAREIAANPSGNFALAMDYDAKPDGKYRDSPVPTTFQGIFEGLGNVISNLHIEARNSTQSSMGFFRQTAAPAIVMNFRMKGEVVVAFSFLGEGGGIIAVGGLAGINAGTLAFNSIQFNQIDVNCLGKIDFWIGEIAGMNEGDIFDSSATGQVEDNVNSGSCLQTVLGGLVGENIGGNIANGSADVTTTGVGSSDTAGGLVGQNSGGAIEASYSYGAVAGGGAAGGFIGSIVQTSIKSTVSDSVSYGTVTGGLVGGFVGYDETYKNGTNGMSNDSWDMTTSGIGPHRGAGNIKNDPGITGFN